MIAGKLKKSRVMAATSLVVLALASAPASAHHEYDYVAPIAAFIAFSALFQNDSHYHYRGHRYRHGGHHGYKPRRHSHSQGGYYQPRRKHHRNW